MKKFISLFIFLACISFVDAVGAKDLSGIDYSLKSYLQSLEKGMNGESAYKSYANISLSTATYNATTLSYSFPVNIVDDLNNNMQWFNDEVSTFSVTQSGNATLQGGTLSTGTAQFNSGSSGLTVTLTGTFSIGDYLTVTLPAISSGVISAVTATQILTFTE